jgi:response regulator RpfG family c-di-GMP phosphodiesterase
VSGAPPTASDPCVLIVDDDPLVLQALETTVSSAGYEAVSTGDPLAGLKVLEERDVSTIIADQRMDAMSGLELLDHAKRLQPHTSRILITGLLSVKTLSEAVNRGEIYRFVAKPWSTPDLINTIHNAVHRYCLLCENAALQAETRKLNDSLIAERRALEERVHQLTIDKTELERLLTGCGGSPSTSFQFCDSILNTFDPVLAARTRRTVEICERLAETARLPIDLRQNLIAAAWLHDLGLIALSREALRAGSGDATGAALRDHPAVSERLALKAGVGEVVAAGVRAHHESFDGGGFPDRLRGGQIPEVARWLTPVAYLASCGLTKEKAIEELERLSGVAFDPHVVPFLLKTAFHSPASDGVALLPPAGARFGRHHLQAEA